ncbi:hypothetical protein Pcinc_000021 [Petrolisthes cinctipes]|uniref:DDE Tnp4 domain-containing protein n=1 Tax=Petrolisthes cinctipes TaxID=88211 RepID=A0AAE1GP89_PETCI|nr:hypothetical protein Pcinc_000021 [Petrolisthes cinctipes]
MEFVQIAEFPGVIGVIDGTHIRITAPKEFEKTRSVVERGIGQLKLRFHVLHGEIRVSPSAKVCMVIEVCAMLHNICKDRKIHIPVGEDHDNGEEDDNQQPLEPPPQPAAERPREGLQYRDEFVNLHFK